MVSSTGSNNGINIAEERKIKYINETNNRKGIFSLYFTSPSWGKMTLPEVTENIKSFLQEDPKAKYKVVIGTDSDTNQKHTLFVTALIIHRIGKGARFYFRKEKYKPIMILAHRIYRETELSLDFVDMLKKNGLANLLADWPMEIHIDIGQQGETRSLIQEVVGWVTSLGYVTKIKPYSYGASSVADRFTG